MQNNENDMATEQELADFYREKEKVEQGIKRDWRYVYALYLVGAIVLAWLLFGL